MKLHIAAVILLFSFSAFAQTQESAALSFDQGIANCENKWSGIKGQDGKTILGYVYVDIDAGFTFEHYGDLNSSEGHLRAVKSELFGKARVISRIEKNFPAICLTESQLTQLGLPSSPEWMKFYKDDRSPAEHHTRWAFHANHIGASKLALEHISKAVAAGASSPALTFEHAFALNALGRFDETIALLTPVISSFSASSDLIAELAFAHLAKGEYSAAIPCYKQALEHHKPSVRRGEFAKNMAYAYEKLGNRGQRDYWSAVATQDKDNNPE